ncbi:hypothetical protein BV22DRAFT_303766 [Leucogyrophana mollusca]|uniref:Uncharacterized protein n=1 Tax=Leucogyrophana mollusca TaxID=85980 RepID=A0ACB8BQP2_9AGAM|nr:hypothetical protein BV22DRAFT_303766 [Leucogyrophana mollusca]
MWASTSNISSCILAICTWSQYKLLKAILLIILNEPPALTLTGCRSMPREAARNGSRRFHDQPRMFSSSVMLRANEKKVVKTLFPCPFRGRRAKGRTAKKMQRHSQSSLICRPFPTYDKALRM